MAVEEWTERNMISLTTFAIIVLFFQVSVFYFKFILILSVLLYFQNASNALPVQIVLINIY